MSCCYACCLCRCFCGSSLSLSAVQADLELILADTNRRKNKQFFSTFLFPLWDATWDASLEFPQRLAKKGFSGYCHNSLGSGSLGPVISEVGGGDLSPFTCQSWQQRLRVTYMRSETRTVNTHSCAQAAKHHSELAMVLLRDLISQRRNLPGTGPVSCVSEHASGPHRMGPEDRIRMTPMLLLL